MVHYPRDDIVAFPLLGTVPAGYAQRVSIEAVFRLGFGFFWYLLIFLLIIMVVFIMIRLLLYRGRRYRGRAYYSRDYSRYD
jgi:uncharacterized protein HemY